MALFDPPNRPADDDALDLFGAETGSPASPLFSELFSERVPSAKPPGAIAFDQIRDTGGIGFVEGVAAIQALCAALQAVGGTSPRVPDISGVFLTAAGEVIASGAPSGDTATRELARILHQLVTPDSMPPAGRLFVGRWSASDSGSLAEFAQELDYFARPNGQELLTGIYARCQGTPSSVRRSVTERPVVLPEPRNTETQKKRVEEKANRDPNPLRRWMNAHRPEVVAGVAIISSVLVTGIVAWLWPAVTPVVAKQIEKIGGRAVATQTIEPASANRGSLDGKKPSSKPKPSAGGNRSKKSAPLAAGGPSTGNEVSLAPPVQQTSESPVAAELPVLPSGTVPDMRVYSEADGGVQPPRLRSAGIPDFLLRGFERRTNVVELIVSERGQVQQARMINEPQRMPDIMVLSRVKELLFEPAVRNGVAVRYKMILKWDVTP